MDTAGEELIRYLEKGLADVDAGRISDGSTRLLDGLNDACDIAREVNSVARNGKIYVTKGAAEDIDELTFDTLQDSSEFVAIVLRELSAAFKELLANPDLGMQLSRYPIGLRAFVFREGPRSNAALFYLISGSDVIVTSYVDEHYKGNILHVLNSN
jgi:hypothetical protein